MVDTALANVFDCLVDAANRLEHLESGMAIPGVLVQSDDAIRRAAWIEALWWVKDLVVYGNVLCGGETNLDDAIARITNGGDL